MGFVLNPSGARANTPDNTAVINLPGPAKLTTVIANKAMAQPPVEDLGEQRMCVKQTHDSRNNTPVQKYVVCLGYTLDQEQNAHILSASINGVKARGFFNVNEPSDLCHHLSYRRARVNYNMGTEVIYTRVQDDNAFEGATEDPQLKKSPFWYQEEGADDAYYPVKDLVCLN